MNNIKGLISMQTLALLGLLLFSACSQASSPEAKNTAPMERPTLRKIVQMAPETVKKQMNEADLQAANSYIEAHPDLPAELKSAIKNHEIWTGMKREEVRHSIGKPSGTEGSENSKGTWKYAVEGWLLQFNGDGYLTSLAEQ